MPALPLDEAGKYVAAAYVVFLALVVVYVAIMASKLQRIERDLRELAEAAEERAETEPRADAGRGGSERPTVSDSLAPHGSGGGSVRHG